MKIGAKKLSTILAVSSLLSLYGCAAMQTTIENKNLSGSSQMSQSIILDPVSNSQKTVHVTIKNTSDQQLNIESRVKRAIESHGYQVVSNPNRAHYLLQANILKVGKMSKSASQSALGGGYGSALSGLAVGAAVGSYSNNANATLGAGLAGGLISMAADALVKDINYSMITDVQVSERTQGLVKETTQAEFMNGTATQTHQQSTKQSHFQRYRTRIISNANKVNLTFADARSALEHGLVKVISGIF